jgi:CubicO group peptidase (beta-lactamase class C family)
VNPVRRIVLVVLLVACPVAVRADAIDDYVRERMRQLRLPGVALTIVRNGTVVTTRSYGDASLELAVPVTPDTVFELGSVTKQFTAVALMMLVEEGKVRLDESIATYLPRTPDGWRGITVQHLATHSSGIQEYLSVPGLPEQAHAARSHDEMSQLFFARLTREFEPGETWAYSNSGYLLLGNIIERASGQSYWDFLRTRLFAPLGMSETRSSDPRAVILHRAAGYGWTGVRFENRPALSENAYAAGSVVSTIRDMARWEAALHAGRLLATASFTQMWTPLTVTLSTPPPFSYGFGWVIDRERGHTVVFHSGGTPGFSSAIRRYPASGLSVIVLANHGDRIVDHIAWEIAGLVDPSVARSRGLADPDPVLTDSLTATVRRLMTGVVEADRFTPAMHRFLTTATGRGQWEWIRSHGELKTLTYGQTDRVGNDSVLRYRALIGEADLWISVTLTPEGRIAQTYWW